MRGEVWLPLEGLGDDAERVERALAGEPAAEVERILAELAPRGEHARAALAAARFALAERGGDRPGEIETLGRDAVAMLRSCGRARAASLIEVELLAAVASSRARLPEALAASEEIPHEPGDALLSAAIHRLRGGLLRSRGDLRDSLATLERSRRLADESGSIREILRSRNTLGASYAALGITALAREALESARELADASGQRQSAAIAAGQLATLALDAGDPRMAARHLRAQRSISEHLGDVRGLARALSLLVEAHAESGDPRGARATADTSRALYRSTPTTWTHLQALLATVYEAEAALSGGDDVRGRELAQSLASDLSSSSPELRVARARSCFISLWAATAGGTETAEDTCSAALSTLSLSPRPTWVERALLLAIHVARARGSLELVPRLAVRAAVVLEARAAASSRSLLTLRQLAPDEAIGRAMALGRDLLLTSRLALAPLVPFAAHVIDIRAKPEPHALDTLLGRLESSLGPDDRLLSLHGPDTARLVMTHQDLADAAVRAIATEPSLLSLTREEGVARLVEDASMGLSLRLE